MGADDLRECKTLAEALQRLERLKARDSLAVYAGLMNPGDVEQDAPEDLSAGDLAALNKLPMAARYVPALHHRMLIDKLEAIERGWIEEDGKRVPFNRLMVFMQPGSAKSTYGSVLFPAWFLGRNPRKSVIQGSYNADLASRFGRRARNTFASPEHWSIFGMGIAGDSGAKNEWSTAIGGEYFAFGFRTGVTGRRADLAILDDPIKGRKEADSKTERESVWETYKADVRTRLKPGAAIVYIATRWHEDDPAGRILPKAAIGKTGWFTSLEGERWYVISLAAVIETEQEAEDDPLGREIGEILWPEWFNAKTLKLEKQIQGSRNWSALYQQKPRPDEGAVLKREHWRMWPGSKPPKCEYVISVYDTAFEEGEQDDYSARTTWGIFWHEERPPSEGGPVKSNPVGRGVNGRYCAILLERWKKRVEFPKLRTEARQHYKLYQPDLILIEKKASGHSLIQELRRWSIPVRAAKADSSKLARAHAASIVLEQGCVWIMDRPWAHEVLEECAAATFIKGSPGNDIPDTCVYAWLHLRKGFHLRLPEEVEEDDEDERNREPTDKRRYV